VRNVVLPFPNVRGARRKIAECFGGSPYGTPLLAGFHWYVAGERVKARKCLGQVPIDVLVVFLLICKVHNINLHPKTK